MAPDDNSIPLHTRSYCHALMVSGSCVSSASKPPCGIENGLCENSTLPVVSSNSYIGKSTIQQNLKISSSIKPYSWPRRRRALPANEAASDSLAQAKKAASPSDRPRRSFMLCVFSAPSALAIGPLASPSSPQMI